MSEKIKKSKSEESQYVPVPTGLKLEDYLAQRAQAKNANVQPQPVQFQQSQFIQPQFQPQFQPQYPANYQPQPQSRPIAEHLTAYPDRKVEAPRKPRHPRKIAALALAGIVVVGGGSYALNVGDIQSALPFGGANADQNNGLTITPLQTLGEKSLAPDQCKDPAAVLMVANVSGVLPLAPMLATKENATATKAAPYLTEATERNLPKDQQSKFEKFITKSGYPEATLNNIPLALTICEAADANAITEQNSALTINRSALGVSFEDPNGMFGTNIYSVPQVDSASNVKIDSNKSEFMSLPNPANNMFLAQGTDAVYNKSVTDMMTSMNDPKQLQVILSTMEVEAVQQLDNVVDGHENIDYPSSAKTLQESIDQALVKRLVGDTKVSPIFTGNYNVQMDVPKNAATKLPVTSNDPTSGASPLKNLDPTQKFQIKSIDIQFGAITPPKVIAQLTPSATPTVTPTPTTGP